MFDSLRGPFCQIPLLWVNDVGIYYTAAMMVKLPLALIVAISAGGAFAALGKAPSPNPTPLIDSPLPVARRLAAATAPHADLYTVQEVQLATGTRVLEYTGLDGTVFAVAWRGPVLPDLSVLLGDYFSTFKVETEQARALGRRGSPVHVARDNLVVHSSGRMRSFSGHAYAPALIPVGVNIKDVLQ